MRHRRVTITKETTYIYSKNIRISNSGYLQNPMIPIPFQYPHHNLITALPKPTHRSSKLGAKLAPSVWLPWPKSKSKLEIHLGGKSCQKHLRFPMWSHTCHRENGGGPLRWYPLKTNPICTPYIMRLWCDYKRMTLLIIIYFWWFWTNPSNKNMRKSNWIIFPQGSGWK